jgi:hypothetical protein
MLAPVITRDLPVPCGGLPSFVVGPAVRIIKVYLNKLDEIVVAEVLRGIVRTEESISKGTIVYFFLNKIGWNKNMESKL